MKLNILLSIALGLVLCIGVAGQAPLRVGDTVEYRCNCFGQEWVTAKVAAVNGGSVRVRYGNMRNQVVDLPATSDLIRRQAAAPSQAEIQRLNQFERDADPYFQSVVKMANAYDDRYLGGGIQGTPAEWQKILDDLAALDNLCRTRYPGITDHTAVTLRDGDIRYRFATWCDLAAKRVEVEKKARTEFAKGQVTLTTTKDNLNFAFDHQKNRVPDETQQLMYDRAKWEQEMTAKLKPRFAQYNVEMPADFFREVEKRADDLKALIERTAPTRAWEQPPFHDAAVEAFIRAKYAAEYKGAQILKAGLDYNTWVERKGLSYLGSDSTFRYYKVEYNYYKRGWVLMKTPNRPFCQASEWIVGKGGKGMVVVTLGGSGIFVRCP